MEHLLLYIPILTFAGAGCLFLLLILLSRRRYIKRAKQNEFYLPVIDKMLSGFLFEEKSLEEILQSEDFLAYSGKKAFDLQLLRSVVQLHIAYAGTYARRLEEFYAATNLKDLSIKKLKSQSWKKKCKGIRELSEMNLESSYALLYRHIDSGNAVLRMEALTGLVRLKGFDGLKLLSDYKRQLNDWTQINMLHVLKDARSAEQADLNFLLNAPNESLVVLGLRVIEKFELATYQGALNKIALKQLEAPTRHQLQNTLGKITSYNLS